METQGSRETFRYGRPEPRSIPAPSGGKRSPSPGILLAGILLAAFLASSCSHAPLSAGPPPRFLPPKEVAAFPGAVLRVSFSPDGGHVALCGEDNAVRIFRTDTWEAERFLETASPRVREIGWNPQGDRIAALADDGIRVLSPRTGKEIRFVRIATPGVEPSPEGTVAEPAGFLWSPSGDRIALSGFDNGAVRVYPGGEEGGGVELKGHYRAVTGMEWGPEEQLFTASWDGTVRRWDVGSGKGDFLTPNLGEGRIRLGRLDSIGALTILSYGDKELLVWDMRSGELKRKVISSAPLVLFRAGREAGLAALADTNGAVWIREISGWNVTRVLSAGGYVTGGFVEEIQWSPRGRYLAAKVAGDPAVAVWDVVTGGSTRLWVREDELVSLDWSPDGLRLVTGGRSGKVREWVLAPDPERR
jgi:WD40 repeat protein